MREAGSIKGRARQVRSFSRLIESYSLVTLSSCAGDERQVMSDLAYFRVARAVFANVPRLAVDELARRLVLGIRPWCVSFVSR